MEDAISQVDSGAKVPVVFILFHHYRSLNDGRSYTFSADLTNVNAEHPNIGVFQLQTTTRRYHRV